MKSVFVALATCFRVFVVLFETGGKRRIACEMIMLRVQLIAANRKVTRAPNLSPIQRLILSVTPLFISRRRFERACVLIKPSTVLKFHRWLIKRKYSKLYSNKVRHLGRPRISADLIRLVIEIKAKNPRFGCPQIAALVKDRTGKAIGNETVRRILKKHFFGSPNDGPSWLVFFGHQVDSLWSIDLFRVESIILQTHWVLVVMDQFTRRIVGFEITKGEVSGSRLCFLFNQLVSVEGKPKHLSRDNDPLFQFHRWKINLEFFEIDEVRSIPFTPTSHPFVERLIETIRRDFTDLILFWNINDLERKLESYKQYFNNARVHQGLKGTTPAKTQSNRKPKYSSVRDLSWRQYCGGLFNVPIAA